MSSGSSDRTLFGDWWLTLFSGKPAHLRFMLEIARYANRDGEVRVSALTIAQRMGTTERHAFAYRKAAIDAGALTEIRTDGRHKVYRINYSNPADTGHANLRHASQRHADEQAPTPANEQPRPLPTAVQGNGYRNGFMNGERARALAEQADALSGYLLDSAIENGIELGHFALDRRKWCFDNREHGVKLIEAFGLETCKIRALALVMAVKSGKITDRRIGTALLFRCWTYREVADVAKGAPGDERSFDEMMGVA